ncbi:hypothetical protein [Sphingorhabdus sp. Alg239-R122]|uniref:hypothetical protein n=1 Tax=Sphingorhabdus sp. Alg239-R122 TaxID=2305989 RepID=UPI0013DCFD1F|nr:hypothetical protein [Sphingorhabdus sp. Alg239-R122]
MSRQLRLSAILSLFLMAGFASHSALRGSTETATGPAGKTIANMEACVSSALTTPDLPFLGLQ